MQEWLDNKRKNGCQIEFDDTDGQQVYKSLYLDTLGADARRSPSPVERHYKATQQQRPSSCCEGYLHGPLSTAGIHGASPTHHSLTKQKQLLLEAAADLSSSADITSSSTGNCSISTAVPRPNLLGQLEADPGMRPKVLIKANTNKPDLTHTTADIDGAQPHPKDVCHRPRDTNPLSPQYTLATGSGLLQFPNGPVPPDKLLRNTLDVTDIPGAVVRPKTPAARVAAAKAAAGAAGQAAGACSSSSPGSSRPGLLDVADIEGATAAWRPAHRRHNSVSGRDSCLNVSDINAYMARFKPAPRNSAEYKGHPQGPRASSPIRPRSNPAVMDNSLRKFDIEGTSVRLAPRATHTTCLDVADIEGTHPTSKDRAQLYAARKGAAAATSAQQAAVEGVLSELQLKPRELLLLWNECSTRDRDRSGLLTGQELLQAMQQVQVQLSPVDAQRLTSALQRSNSSLLNYKKLTRQLKGRMSRPASALAAPVTGALPAELPQQQVSAGPQRQQRPQSAGLGSAMHVSAGQQRQQRPQSAVLGSARHPFTGSQASETPDSRHEVSSSVQAVSSSRGSSRPASAPPRPSQPASSGSCCCGAGAAVTSSAQECNACASSWGSSNRVGVSAVSHWFGGSRRDVAAAAETAHWRPGPAADAITKSWGLNGPAPWDPDAPFSGTIGSQADSAAAAAAVGACGGGLEGGCSDGGSPDVVPAWLIGADAVYGTCKASQPFGCMLTAAAAQGQSLGEAVDVAVDQLMPAERHSLTGYGQRPSSAAPKAAAECKRPSSAGPRLVGPGAQARQQQQQQMPWAGSRVGSPSKQHQSHQRPMSACQPQRRCMDLASGGAACRVGLAEQRRLRESQQQDLLAVRLLT